MTFDSFRTYDDFRSYFRFLEEAFPDLVYVEDIGESFEG
jgi:hypothetical protein